MGISAVLAMSTHGMQDNARRLAHSAQAIASGPVAPAQSGAGHAAGLELADEMLEVITAGHSFAANASVFETGADMWDIPKTIVRD